MPRTWGVIVCRGTRRSDVSCENSALRWVETHNDPVHVGPIERRAPRPRWRLTHQRPRIRGIQWAILRGKEHQAAQPDVWEHRERSCFQRPQKPLSEKRVSPTRREGSMSLASAYGWHAARSAAAQTGGLSAFSVDQDSGSGHVQ